jgi:hypothetical protein
MNKATRPAETVRNRFVLMTYCIINVIVIAGTEIIKARIVLVANRFPLVIFRGPLRFILLNCFCSIGNPYKSMSRMSMIFRYTRT